MSEQRQKPEQKRQRRIIITIWEGGITEVRVPKITLNRRQMLFLTLVIVTLLVGIDRLPEIIEGVRNLLVLVG